MMQEIQKKLEELRKHENSFVEEQRRQMMELLMIAASIIEDIPPAVMEIAHEDTIMSLATFVAEAGVARGDFDVVLSGLILAYHAGHRRVDGAGLANELWREKHE